MESLAINGGNPVREDYLTYGKQWITDDDIEAVVNVLKGDYLTTGPNVETFEKKVAEYVGAKYGVAVSNGTAGLHIACLASDIKEGDEVIVSSITFAASSNCVLYCGGTPVFADINPKTYNIDVDKIEDLITDKTKAIVAVDYTGQPVDIDRIREISYKHNLIFIEDSAHALGAEYKGVKVGSQADMTMFSFHPVKPITTAEGGIIVTNDEGLYNRLRLFRSHGIEKDKSKIKKNSSGWYHEQQLLGYNYRLTDLQAALGSSQMTKIDTFISRRREIAKTYNDAFKDMEEINVPYQEEFSNSGWHLYVITLNLEKLVDGTDRNDVFNALEKENIGVNLHYIPVYLHPYYRELGYESGICPEAEEFFSKVITLPLFPKMEDKDIEDVITAVKKVLDYFRR